MFQPPSSSKREVCNKPGTCLGDVTKIAKIFYFSLSESLKNSLFRTFSSPKSSLEHWILHFLCKNLPEYPPDITMWTSAIVYLIPQNFSWFKNYRVLISKLVPDDSFNSTKTIKAFIDTDLLIMMKMLTKSNTCT